MPALIMQIIIQIAIMIIIAAMTKLTHAPAAKISDYNLPTASASRNQMLVYGTRKVTGSNNFFADDISQESIVEKGNLITPDIVTGTKYYIGFALGLSFGGETELIKISVEDKDFWVRTDETYDANGKMRFSKTNNNFFSDDWGLGGTMTHYQGSDIQLPDEYINRFYEAPGYRGLSYMVFESFYIGNSTTVQAFDFYLKRIPTTNTDLDNWADINGNCNPAVVAYDILTDQDYGIGTDPDLIDMPSFLYAAEYLYGEAMGLSITYEDKFSCDDFISEILKCIAGTLVEDATTGKFKLKLSRDDYDVETLFEFNTSNIISVGSYARNTQDKLNNEVKVTYNDQDEMYKERIAMWQNTALRMEKEGNDSYDVAYPWITDSVVANNLAKRDAIPTSVYMSSMELETARVYGLEVGQAVIVRFEPYRIEKLVYRISEIDYGTYRNNTMRIFLVQDNFGIQVNSYTPPPKSVWPGFDFSAQPCDIKVIDAPYFYDVEGFDVLTWGQRPNSVALNYDLYTKRSGESSYNNNGRATSFAPTAEIVSALTTEINSTIIITSTEMNNIVNRSEGQDARVGYNLCIIESSNGFEFIDFENIVYDSLNNQYQLQNTRRGLLDTIPKDHEATSKIYFISYGLGLSQNISYSANDTIDLKPLTRTGSDSLKIDDANTFSHTFGTVARSQRPPAPIDVKADGKYFWEVNNVGQNDITIEYLVRYFEELKYVSDYTTSQPPSFESGGNLGIKPDEVVINIYDDTDTLIKTYNEAVSSSYPLSNSVTFDDETTINPLGEYYSSLRVEIHSLYNNNESVEKYDFVITRA